MSSTVVAPATPRRHVTGFWRRLTAPVLNQLTQGVTPDRIAATLALGTACALFPFLGFTSLLNLGIGIALRLNQPILQGLNQLLGPVQLALILVHVRIGEVIWHDVADRFTIGEMIRQFRDASFMEFLQQFGWAGIHALTAWVLLAPLIAGAVFLAVRPVIRRAAGAKTS